MNLYFRESEQAASYSSIWTPDLELEMIQHFQNHPEEMYSMAPRKFEELIAAIFKNHGFRVELTPATRDGGLDIIAIEDSIITGESVHLVECKRYAPVEARWDRHRSKAIRSSNTDAGDKRHYRHHIVFYSGCS